MGGALRVEGVRQPWRGGEVPVAPDIAIDRQERPVAEQRQRRGDAAGGLQRSRGFRRVGDVQAVGVPDAERRDDLFAEMRVVDDDIAVSGCREPLQVPDDQRLAAGPQQGLRRRVGEWPQTFAATGGEDHGFHQKV